MKDKVLIIDCNSIIHRGYHAIPKLNTKDGTQVNAVYGFFAMFLKALNIFKPKYVCACFDVSRKTFRNEIFKDYKGTRTSAPDDLYPQFDIVKNALDIFNITRYEKKGFEADDLIATVVKNTEGLQRIIMSGDMDNAQLVTKDTQIYGWAKAMKNNVIYDLQRVREYFGIEADQVVDYKSLVGDSSDNIPGAKGIGKKTAVELLSEYGNVKNLYEKIETGEAWDIKEKLKGKLIDNKEQVFMSYTLAKMKDDVFELDLKECLWEGYGKQKAMNLFDKLEFASLKDKLPK